MPFLPVFSPSLGLSQLKAELTQAGLIAEIRYPALDLLTRLAALGNAQTAAFDYKLLASSTDIGETLFAAALWKDSRLEDRACEAITELLNAGGKTADEASVQASVARLLTLPRVCTEFIEELASIGAWGDFPVVGFSTVFSQSAASLALARRIKAQHPHVTILFGGPNVDGDMGVAMMRSFPFVDAVLRGEADLSLSRYLKARATKDQTAIPGLVFRDERGAHEREAAPAVPVFNLDARPIPDFSDYFRKLDALPFETVDRDELTLPIETSRGCWWGAVKHCVFCGLNPSTMEFRSKSPGRAIAEFDAMAECWGIDRFLAVDNIIDMRYFRAVLPALEGRGYRIFYETKSNLREDHVAQLARAGVRTIQPGIEGLNSRTLRLMDKGAKGRQGIELLKWCSLYEIAPLWFYLYGFPGEHAEDYRYDIGMMPLLWHLPPPKNPNPIVLDRYSPLFRDRETLGYGRLRPSRNTEIYYAGLDPAERTALAYHFDNTAPTSQSEHYERALWRAVMLWRARQEAGAFLVHLRGSAATLVLDGRFDERPRATLLTGTCHALLHELRTARILDAADLSSIAPEPLSEDAGLFLAAASRGGDMVCTDGRDDARAALIERGLAIEIDSLLLALTIDLRAGPLADKLDLTGLLASLASAGAPTSCAALHQDAI